MSIILGIDPGSRITGYGIVKVIDKNCTYIDSGCIRVSADILSDKLRIIFDGITHLMREYMPESVAVESVFMHKNASAALKLGQARGAAIVAASIHQVIVHEYSARQVKQSVVGYGGANKEQVQHMVCNILNLSKSPQADAADGLAVALCHNSMSSGLLSLTGTKKISRGRMK